MFNKIIQTIFISLNGEDTIKQNQLIVTDEDSAEYEPTVNVIKTTEGYAKSSHMLCIFHALAKKFKETVYPTLLHEKDGKNLSQASLKYGK